MSRIAILKSILTISLGAVIGYTSVDYLRNKNSSHRYLASVTMSKMASEQVSKSLIDMRLRNIEVGLLADDVSTIRMSLQAFKPLPAGVSYTWNLPNDVQIVEGQISDQLPEMAANQTKEIIIKVKGYNKLKKNYISFLIEGNIENTRFKRESLVSSRPEDSFEYVVQDYERSQKAEARAMNKMGKTDYKAPIDIKKVVH